MVYQQLNFLAPDPVYCYCKARPRGEYVPAYKMTDGISIAEVYPEDPFAVEMWLDPDAPGLKLASFLGNAGSLILLHKTVAACFLDRLTLGETECYPFRLMNHKGRVHSDDYVFFNPVGSYDCLDLERSVIFRRKDGSVNNVEKAVLDSRKLDGAPDIFRIREDPAEVLFSRRAIDLIGEQAFTNFSFNPVEHR